MQTVFHYTSRRLSDGGTKYLFWVVKTPILLKDVVGSTTFFNKRFQKFQTPPSGELELLFSGCCTPVFLLSFFKYNQGEFFF
jgi:hypothetical protein